MKLKLLTAEITLCKVKGRKKDLSNKNAGVELAKIRIRFQTTMCMMDIYLCHKERRLPQDVDESQTVFSLPPAAGAAATVGSLIYVMPR